MNSTAKTDRLNEDSDETLALSAKNGDGDALTALIQRYAPLVRLRVRVYAKGALDADDLFQEGMIALLKAVRNYRDEEIGSFKTFAVVCINNKLISAFAAHMRDKNAPMRGYLSLSEESVSEEQLADSPSRSDPALLLITGEETDARNRRIETLLSEFEQQVLRFYLNSFSYDEMAARLGSSTKAVDNALQRVRRKLRSAFTAE